MVLGIVSLFAWLVPFLGFPIAVAGLVLGIVAINKGKEPKGMAIAGVVMCPLGLIGSIISAVLVFLIGLSVWQAPPIYGY